MTVEISYYDVRLVSFSCRACCVDVQLLAPYQESLALLGKTWNGGFLGDRDNVAPCTLLIEWMLC